MKKHMLSKIVSLTAAAAIALSCFSINSFALDDDETVTDENFVEDFVEDEGSDEDVAEEEDTAIAGAFNDERDVTVPAKRIRLKSGSLKTLNLGESFQIKAVLNPLNSDDYITYRSYSPYIAQVTDDGIVTAVGTGVAKIQLKTSTGVKANVHVTVVSDGTEVDQKVSSISIVDENMMIRTGKTSNVEYILYPIGSKDTVTFSSSKPEVAEVSDKGVITGISDGSATITVKTAGGITAECYVTVYSGVYKGIDVSKWQDSIKWSKVKNSGIDFAMIRSSFGNSDVDVKLAENVAGCEKYGISYGFYHYTYAKTVSEAKKEAKFMLKTIKNYSPEYPIVLDIEEAFYKKMTRKQVTDIIQAFVEEIENAGYYAMVYSYATFFNDYVDMSRMTPYDIWIACWGDKDRLDGSYDYHYGMWQYSSTGTVSGISGKVDLDYAYKDYASRIRKYGLNNL